MTELMIEANRVSKAFGSVTALDDVSVAVPRGTVLGLLGHNGAGKTTLVNVLTTLLPPTSGSATADMNFSRQAISAGRENGFYRRGEPVATAADAGQMRAGRGAALVYALRESAGLAWDLPCPRAG